MGKLTLKLLCSIGALTLLLAGFLLYLIYSTTQVRVQEMVEKQASMALKFELAIRSYAAEHIRPAMWELVGKDEFIPETMSTSFIARSIFEEVRSQFPDYIIKFSSDNPRNPVNRAGKEELELIDYFNENPQIKEWQGELEIDGKPYMGKFNARRMNTSCLPCHGDPADAPSAMVKQYGATAGFNHPMGEVIGLDMVAIPLTRVSAMLRQHSLSKVVMTGLAIVSFFLATAFLIRTLMINRLNRMATHLRSAADSENYITTEHMETGGHDEITDIAVSFNTLIDKLHDSYALLETKVHERTQELKAGNEDLKIQQETLSSIFRAAPTGIGMVSNRLIIQVNKRLCTMLGYEKEELIGLSARMLYPDQKEFERVGREKYEQIAKDGTGTVETKWLQKDGQIIDVLLSSTPLELNDLSKGVTFTALDITAQKIAAKEKATLEKMLARSKNMEALGLLAGGVAHDLNNVLSGIVSYPDLLLLELPEESPLRKPILTIQNSGRKADAIVQDLLTLARRGVTNNKVLNLNQVVSEYLESPEHKKIMSYCPGVEIRLKLTPSPLNILGSDVHIKKSIMNLVVNATEAVQHSGVVAITTLNRHLDAPPPGYEKVSKGEYLVLRVQDDGSGINRDDLNHIFEPFYTKKIMGKSGTGLGMSVVWGTVQDHKGYITVDSTPGEGTSFDLYFPTTTMGLEKEIEALDLATYTGNRERILIVDDDEQQREIASAMLEKLGYRVAIAASGEAALSHLEGNQVDLVILDMIMEPGIDGMETYRRIAERFPGTKALITSGFSETDRLKEAQRLGAGEYVKKPYSLERIGLAVRNVFQMNTS